MCTVCVWVRVGIWRVDLVLVSPLDSCFQARDNLVLVTAALLMDNGAREEVRYKTSKKKK